MLEETRSGDSFQTRIGYFDILKGIGIIFLVWGHTALLPNVVAAYFQSFYMPLFFFTSGYFFKKKEWKIFWRDITKQLLVPYLFATIFFAVVSSALRGG